MKILLVGQPNVGKSRLANLLAGTIFKVANFTGVTLRQNTGWLEIGGKRQILIDLPGLYSLTTCTPEEELTKSCLDSDDFDVMLNVVNATQLQKNLPLTFQLMDLNRPLVLVVNMVDELPADEARPDFSLMAHLLGIPILPVSAATGEGINALRLTLEQFSVSATCSRQCSANCQQSLAAQCLPPLSYDYFVEESVEKISEKLREDCELAPDLPEARAIALRLLEGDRITYRRILEKPIFVDLHDQLRLERANLAARSGHQNAAHTIASARTALAKGIMAQIGAGNLRHTPSDRLDQFLLHPLFGLPILLALMWTLFQATFHLGEEAAALIREIFSECADLAESALPAHDFSKALTRGAIPAVGSVLSFLPNILVLFLGINLLEQSGYMARAAYLLDGTMKRFGLHGRAFIPLITGFGCSVPAYMAAHTLRSPRDRMLTLLVIGFFSCSARLPVYVLFVSAFFAPTQAGNALFVIYASGPILALLAARLLRLSLLRGCAEPFVMELPRYRFPALRPLGMDLGLKARMFIKRAGTKIGLISMLIWFLGSYPAPLTQTSMATAVPAWQLEHSYLGQIGQIVEPVFAPIGFDWKLSVAILSALAAKEAAVGTLATLYQIENDEGNLDSLSTRLRESVDFKTGVAFILIIMTYSPCIAAMSAFFAQVPFWKWRFLYLTYPNILAWLLAFLAYRILALLTP